jgi:hypothetical protein
MDSKKGLSTATIILYTILLTFTCLSCGFTPATMCDHLKKAKVPIYLPELEPTTSTQNYKVALNFGIAVSDALVCIYNEDQAASPRYMGMVYDYAKKLGMPEPVLRKLAGITAAMEQGDWQKVLQLSEKFGYQVFDRLGKISEEDAGLAFLAGELEGIYIAAKSVDNQFSPESAKLLRQQGPFKLDGEDKSPPSLKAKKEFKAIMAALPKINQIINRPENYTYTHTDVKELVSICEPLRKILLND